MRNLMFKKLDQLELSPFLPSRFFPHVEEADELGLLGVGGRLTPDWLVDSYAHGIFPWPFSMSDRPHRYHLGWFSPDPRCIFEPERFRVARRLERTCRSGRFRTTLNTDFEGVIRGCAEAPGREEETWITEEMRLAYLELHRLGLAHSVETWLDDRLVGGVYGVALRGLFAAESMFYRQRDASKVALVALVRHLEKRGFRLLDIQMKTDHTARFGAIEISRDEYLKRLDEALRKRIFF